MALSVDLLHRLLKLNTGLSGEFALAEMPDEEVETALGKVKAMMRDAEGKKYPEHLFEVQNLRVAYNGQRPLDIKYVKRTNLPFTHDTLQKMTQSAVKVRKLDIIAGVMYAMEHAPSYLNLSDAQKIKLQQALLELAEDIHDDNTPSPDKPREQLDPVIREIVRIIKLNSPLDEQSILRQIRNAERYYIAENSMDKALLYDYTHDRTTAANRYLQMDVPFNRIATLTDVQKKNYLLIHEADKNKHPAWFKDLPKWEQECLQALIPKNMEGDWSRLAQSSAMQHIPGLKNARVNILFEVKGAAVEVLSRSTKTSTLVPFEMTAQNMIHETQDNAEEILAALEKQAADNFQRIWGVSATERNVKPLVLVQSLMGVVALVKSDANKANLQKAAVKKAAENYPDVQVIVGDDPVNATKLLAFQGEKRWEYANEVMAYARDFLSKMGAGENPRQQEYIRNILNELEKMNDTESVAAAIYSLPFIGKRNYEEFKVAYLSLLVEAIGGAVSTNCKSGKDRTGLDELYRHAMRIYYHEKGRMPGFTDDGVDRMDFVAIYAQLFNTRKAQEAAGMNTPSASGLKDLTSSLEAVGMEMMLCGDIVKYLDESYQQSNELANMNKPKIFLADEASQKKETKAKKSSAPVKSGFFSHADHPLLKDRVEANFNPGKSGKNNYQLYFEYADQGVRLAEETLDLDSARYIQHENDKIISDLTDYLKQHLDSDFTKEAAELISQLTLYNSRIFAIEDKLSRDDRYFVAKEDVFETNSEEEAIRHKDELLNHPVNKKNLGIDEDEPGLLIKTRASKYVVTRIQNANVDSVTISSASEHGLSSKIYFSDSNPPSPSRQKDAKGFLGFLPGVKRTSIPNDDVMAWAKENVDIFLLDKRKKLHHLRGHGMTKEQAEAVEIYCRYYTSTHPETVIKCTTHYKFDDETLNRKVNFYKDVQASKGVTLAHREVDKPN
jgi:hypothetical protein